MGGFPLIPAFIFTMSQGQSYEVQIETVLVEMPSERELRWKRALHLVWQLAGIFVARNEEIESQS